MALEHIESTIQITQYMEQIMNSCEAIIVDNPETENNYQETIRMIETYLSDTGQFIILYRNLYDDDPILFAIELVIKRIQQDKNLLKLAFIYWSNKIIQKHDLAYFHTFQTELEDVVFRLYLSFSQIGTLLHRLDQRDFTV